MADKPTSNSPDSNSQVPLSEPAIVPTSNTPYIQPYIGKLGWDTDDPQLFGLGASPDNGVTFHVFASFDGLVINDSVINKMWPGVEQRASDFVDKEVKSAQAGISSAVAIADSAASAADSAVANSKVNSDAIAAMSSAVSAAKSGADQAIKDAASAIAGVGSTANAIKSDAAAIQSQVSAAQSTNAASVKQMQSDISNAQQAISAANDSITKAEAANSATAKQLADYTAQAQAQGKTIKELQSDADSTKLTIADVKGNVVQVQDSITGLQGAIKDTNGNVDTIKAQADSLSSTLTDAKKNISTLQSRADKLESDMKDAQGNITTAMQTASQASVTASDAKSNVATVVTTASEAYAAASDANSNAAQAKLTASAVQVTASDAKSDVMTVTATASDAKLIATNAQSQALTAEATANKFDVRIAGVEGSLNDVKDKTEWKEVDAQTDMNTLTTQQNVFLKNPTNQPPGSYWWYVRVVPGTDDHITQYAVSDRDNKHYTRQLIDDGWTAWTKTADQTDIADLNGKITTNATAIDQNKKEIALSAKQTTVDNLTNQLSEANAQLKVQAGEISAKADSTTVTGLTDTVNGLKDAANWKIVSGLFDANNYTTTQHIFYQDTQAVNTPNSGWFYLTVNAPRNDRVTQTLTKDNSTDTWTRIYNGSWSAWQKQANQADVTNLQAVVQKNSTEITNNSKAIQLKADKSTTDVLNKSYSDQQATLKTLAGEIQSKVTSADVQGILKNGKYATEDYTQSIVDQTSKSLNSTITEVKRDVTNGQNDVATKISNITQSIDGIQTTVGNKADKSTVTQLANTYQIKLQGNTLIDQSAATTYKWSGHNNEYEPIAAINGLNNVTAGTQVYLSFDYQTDSDVNFVPQFDDTPWIPFGDMSNPVNAKGGVTGHYSKAITVSDDSWKTSPAKHLCIRCDNWSGSMVISNLKMTSGENVSSELDMLNNNINLRVKKGDLVSQINQEAGGNTLIQVANGKGKLYLDADSTAFSGKAFIPSAAITNLDADKITSGHIAVPMQDNNGNSIVLGNTGINISSGLAKLTDGEETGFALNLNSGGLTLINHRENSDGSKQDDYRLLQMKPEVLHPWDGSSEMVKVPSGMIIRIPKDFSSKLGPESPGGYLAIGRSSDDDQRIDLVYCNKKTNGWEEGLNIHTVMYVKPYGTSNMFRTGWVSWSNWDNGERYPAIVNNQGPMGGICFPSSSKVTLFDSYGHVFWPSQSAYTKDQFHWGY